ncbi:C-C motif chemokine 20-like [Heterodontus francisci]|uniref:C-C motif chemokine 20-like n=1 Tax=Heterodontus francisci TaxID=7792 RepID=UPI00355BEAF0
MIQMVLSCRKLITAMLMGLFVLCMMERSPFADAQSPIDCCLSYSKKGLPQKLIAGYVRQFSNELCGINAVIFHTRKGRSICANPEDEWVKRIIIRFLKKEMKQN